MNAPADDTLLARALDQTAGLLDEVTPAHYDSPSTCQGWTVGDLVRHVVASPRNFVAMVNGESVDWANPPKLREDPAGDFRESAAQLVEHARGDASGGAFGAAIPEFAVHSWDLATSIGSRTPLDDEVAEHALAFMTANLTAENRAGAFEDEVPADQDASIHDRLAAFAGRSAAAATS